MLITARFQPAFATVTLGMALLMGAVASAADVADQVSTMAGSLNKWITNHPRLAVEMIRQREHFLAYASPTTGVHSVDRAKQVESGKKQFEDAIARFVRSAPGQIEGDLKRVEREIERMGSDRPNPRQFNSIAIGTLGRTAEKVGVLRATGELPPELDSRYQAAIESASEIIAANREAFRDLTRVPRDRYRSDDDGLVREAAIKVHRGSHPDERVLGTLLPEQNWQTIYGALWDDKTNDWKLLDEAILPVVVIVEGEQEEALLSRVVLSRPSEGGPIKPWDFADESPLPRPAVRRDQIKQ